MPTFTASQARELAQAHQHSTEYTDIIQKIKIFADGGKFQFFVYNSPLSESTYEKLQRDGFTVQKTGSIEQQKDQLFAIISW